MLRQHTVVRAFVAFTCPVDAAGPEIAVDEHLIDRCRAGDPSAWRELVEQYERLVFSIAVREGLTRDQAGDLTQTVFLILLRSLHTLRSDVTLASWLGTVTRRQSWRVRDRSRRDLVGLTADDADRSHHDPDHSEVVEWVHQGMDRLGARCRELITALYLSGSDVPYAQIAEQLQMPVGSIGPTRARCLAQLRTALEALDQD